MVEVRFVEDDDAGLAERLFVDERVVAVVADLVEAEAIGGAGLFVNGDLGAAMESFDERGRIVGDAAFSGRHWREKRDFQRTHSNEKLPIINGTRTSARVRGSSVAK